MRKPSGKHRPMLSASVVAGVAACAILLVGCGPKLEDQRPPLYSRKVGDSLCNATAIMDASGILATEHGCEARSSGWKVRRVGANARDAVVRGFDALPPPGVYGKCQGPKSVVLRLTLPDGSTRQWDVCGDAGGFAAAFDTVGQALNVDQ